tara:strand:- start:3491 stop:3877 length:387 start_codon:yes stop_codon:yes gene_type:complete
MEFSFLNPQESMDEELNGMLTKYTDLQLQYSRNTTTETHDLILQEYSDLQNDFPESKPSVEVVGNSTGFTNLLQDFKPNPFLKCTKQNKQACDDSKLNDFPSLKVFKPKTKCKYFQDSSFSQTKCVDI